MNARALRLAASLLAAVPGVLAGQLRTHFRASGVYEVYTFDTLLTYNKMQEFAAPIGVDLSFGRAVDVSLSSGYVSLVLTSANTAQLPHQDIRGMLNTEVRIGYNLVPGRLILVANGSVPTGVRPAATDELSILGAVSSDVIGFAVPSLGTGGSVGGGVVGALPVGRFAVGVGATYSYPLAYKPVDGDPRELQPGADIRGRLGIEGALARTTFLRAAAVVGVKAKDRFADTTQNKLGARLIGYVELVQGLGNMQLTAYGYDVYRGSPSVEPTAVGQAILPKGNLIVAGLRHSIPVGRSLSVSPRVEYRMPTQSQVDSTDASGFPVTYSRLLKTGSSVRIGADLRQTLRPGMAVALYGSGLFGDVRQAGYDVPLSGWRAGLVLEFTP
jgi:hypothetical protein